jgi:4-amino-4-deoxy-L-arabinose transferase-like glycosyltransferase
LYDEPTALWSIGVAFVIPLFAVGSILMTIDPLSVFFWAWGANLAWRGVETGKVRYWLLLGAAAGIGFLAKFINAAQLFCLILFLLWSQPHRRFFFSRQSGAALLTFAITSFPVFWWNVQTGWLNVQALRDRGGLGSSLRFNPSEFFRYLGGESGAITPLILIGMVVAAIGLWRGQRVESRVKFLLTQFVPIPATYVLLSLTSRVEPNWIAPSLIAGIVVLVAFWRPFITRNPRWRWAPWLALGSALVITVFLHATTFFPLPVKFDLFRRGEGWPDFARHVQRAREQAKPEILIANYYAQASMMQFYLPDHPFAYVPPAPYGNSQFTLWPGYTVGHGTRALYVTDGHGPLPQQMKDEFTHSELLDDFWSQYQGRDTTHFQIYVLTND